MHLLSVEKVGNQGMYTVLAEAAYYFKVPLSTMHAHTRWKNLANLSVLHVKLGKTVGDLLPVHREVRILSIECKFRLPQLMED